MTSHSDVHVQVNVYLNLPIYDADDNDEVQLWIESSEMNYNAWQSKVSGPLWCCTTVSLSYSLLKCINSDEVHHFTLSITCCWAENQKKGHNISMRAVKTGKHLICLLTICFQYVVVWACIERSSSLNQRMIPYRTNWSRFWGSEQRVQLLLKLSEKTLLFLSICVTSFVT